MNENNIRFSIEIEVEFPIREQSEQLISEKRLIPGWEIDFDASLTNGAEYRPTLKNKLFLNKNSLDQIAEILGLIKAHRGKVNSHCGFHVHVDMKKFKVKEVIHIVKNFIKKQNSLVKKFKVKRNRLTTYCEKINKIVLRELNLKSLKYLNNYSKNVNDYFTNRHYLLNLTSLERHHTLEFRLFNGTLNLKTIEKYVKFCILFCINNRKKIL